MTSFGKAAMRALTITLLFLFGCVSVFSQNTISGVLQDAKSEKPVQYANVSLLRQSDSVLVSHTYANDKGEFQLQMVPKGDYRLIVYFFGYENSEQNLSVNKDMDLGTIKLTPGSTSIGEVTVKGERPLFAVDGEKTYYNTAEDPTVQTGTASDVLQNAPGVSVDVEGNVTLRGTSSVEIWINDKPSHMNAENLKTYLQQMPANSIDHVEVITNPSARYGSKADGIINIVTTTKVKKNQFVSFGANASIKPYVSPWVSYVWSNEKLSINLYTNFSYSRSRNYGYGDITMYRDGLEGLEMVSTEHDSSRSVSHNFGGGLHFSIDYEIDSMNNLSFWGGTWPHWSNSTGYDELYRLFPADSSVTSYFSNSDSRSRSYWGGFGAYYQHKFDNKGHNLSLDVNGDSWGWGSHGRMDRTFTSPVLWMKSKDSQSKSRHYSINAELTYNRPYSENGEISVGYYGEFDMGSNYYHVDTLRETEWVMDSLQSNFYRDPTLSNQVFFTLQHKFGNFTIKPGVRFEHEYIMLNYPEIVPDTFGIRKHYFHIRPSLHLSYRTKSMHNFRLSYTFRSSNPDATQLTRFLDFGEESFSSGNPYLQSILTHSLEAGWQKFWTKFGSVGFTVYFKAKSRDVNEISEPRYHDVYGRVVPFEYPVNVGKAYNTGMELNTMYRPNAMFNMRFYANVYHSYIESLYYNELYKSGMWSYSFSLSLWAKLWKRIEINVSGNYRSPSQSLFSTSHAFYGLNAGLRCDFFDKKLSIYLNANDIFNWNKWGRSNNSPYYISSMDYNYDSRSIALGFTLRFGKMELEQQARQGAASESSGGGMGN